MHYLVAPLAIYAIGWSVAQIWDFFAPIASWKDE